MIHTAGIVLGIFGAILAFVPGCASGVRPDPPAVRSGYAPVDGLKLYYEIHGTAIDGRVPLVLIHGGGSTIETSFGKVLPILARTRQVIAFEQQGHGHTTDVDRPFDFGQSAEDAVGLIRYLGIGEADFFGYSNGGHIAIEIALRHPEVVRRLVVESAMFDREGSDADFWKRFDSTTLAEMPAELKEAYLKTAPRPQDLPVFFEKSVARMRAFKGWTRDEIRSIVAPTLVLVGDRDIVRPEHAIEMVRLLPHAHLGVLPGTDHMAIVDRAGLVCPIVESFLDAPMTE